MQLFALDVDFVDRGDLSRPTLKLFVVDFDFVERADLSRPTLKFRLLWVLIL